MKALGTRTRERRRERTLLWPFWTVGSPSETIPTVWMLEGLLVLPAPSLNQGINKPCRREKGKGNEHVSHTGVKLLPALPNNSNVTHVDPISLVDKPLFSFIQKT